jgi:Flp pilus assembly protein TadG
MNRRDLGPRAQRGAILVLAAGLLLALAGFALLAIDVGRIFVVRGELQNAADAAALAGANCLARESDPASPDGCAEAFAASLNWDRAAARAGAELSRNSVDNQALSATDGGNVVEVGYWNLQSGSASGGSFSTAAHSLTAYDRPAVRVSITKDAGKNGGPLTMLTRLLYGTGTDVPMSAQAVAVLSSPDNVLAGTLIPQAINQCMFDQYWDSAAGAPVVYTGAPKDPQKLSVVGQSWTVRIGSAYHYGKCDSGQWTTFAKADNSQPAVGALIAHGNPDPVAIGDMTWIQPGTKDSSYHDLDARYPTPPGADVLLPVVETSDLSKKARRRIVAFAGFHIEQIDSAGKFIQGRFVSAIVSAGAAGIGPFYGAYTGPRLAQ